MRDVPSMTGRRYARHCARLVAPATMILSARGEGRALAHVAWIAIAGLGYSLLDPVQLGWWSLPTLALFCALALITLFDARYFVIPDGPLLVLLSCGAAMLPLGDTHDILDRLLAAACAYAALRAVDLIYERLRGREGLGLADAKLFALAGLWLGLGALPGCLLLAVASALVSALVGAREGRLTHARQPIPFGPHLALGFWLSWSLGPFVAG